MPSYDSTRFSPPAPIASVSFRNPETGLRCANVSMLIDSGADATLIPKEVASVLGLNPSPNQLYELAGFDGSITAAEVVRLEMIFLGKNFRGQFLLIDQEYGILGRNILNAVTLLFDGPNLNWDELKRK